MDLGDLRIIAVDGGGGCAAQAAAQHAGVTHGDGGHPLVVEVDAGGHMVVGGGVGAALKAVDLAVNLDFLDVDDVAGIVNFAVGNADGGEGHGVAVALLGAGEVNADGVGKAAKVKEMI